jgi:hypothetical protein
MREIGARSALTARNAHTICSAARGWQRQRLGLSGRGFDRTDWADDLYSTSLALAGIERDPLRAAGSPRLFAALRVGDAGHRQRAIHEASIPRQRCAFLPANAPHRARPTCATHGRTR